MLYISTQACYNDNNKFELKEIYISDLKTTYIMKRDEGYTPYPYEISLLDLIEASQGSTYPLLGFSLIRTYRDDDAKSLAAFFRSKISKVDLSAPNAEKTLFDVLSNFGETA